MLRDRIAKYGIELEGAWDYTPNNCVHDGSVTLDGYEFVGEIPSPPITLLDSVRGWIKKNYPHHMNSSCGMHVHMSFKNMADYSLLMDTFSFQDYLLRELEKWGRHYGLDGEHALFYRLDGYNEFCELNFVPDDQVHLTTKDSCRYNVLNYCWSLHKTLEVRVLPMFETHVDAFAAVTEVSRIINTWLKRKRKRKLKKVTEKLVMPNKYQEKGIIQVGLRQLETNENVRAVSASLPITTIETIETRRTQ